MTQFHRTEISRDIDYFAAKLAPLKEGRTVTLQIIHPRGIGKRKNPIVLLAPGILFDLPKDTVVVSVLNNGSCILRINPFEKKPRISDLVRAGIPAKLANALVAKLQHIFKES